MRQLTFVIVALAVAAPAAADELTFVGDDDGANPAEVWTVTASPTWQPRAAADGWRMGVELEYGLSDRWQLEVAGARDGSPRMEGLATTTEAELELLYLIAAGEAWTVSAGAGAGVELDGGELELAFAPSVRGSARAGRWSGHVMLAADTPIGAASDVEVAAVLSGFVELGPVKPLVELAVSRGDEIEPAWRAGAAFELGSFELAGVLGGDAGGAHSVQAVLEWEIGDEDAP